MINNHCHQLHYHLHSINIYVINDTNQKNKWKIQQVLRLTLAANFVFSKDNLGPRLNPLKSSKGNFARLLNHDFTLNKTATNHETMKNCMILSTYPEASIVIVLWSFNECAIFVLLLWQPQCHFVENFDRNVDDFHPLADESSVQGLQC